MGPPRWSALAITAFVLSLLGFLGFTAILGIILGIAGIAVTRGGRRRGMGLAIAAIPISLVTGAFGALFLVTGVMVWRMGEMSKRIEPALSASSADVAKSADEIFAMGSLAFQSAAPKDRIETWLADVKQKHGTLSGFERQDDLGFITRNSSGGFVLNLRGKFTNGPALVRVRFSPNYILNPHIDDIDVDGNSPLAPSGDPTTD
jgi:hypothetical protein